MLKLKTLGCLLVLTSLVGCKQELPKTVEQKSVFGTVQEIQTVNDQKQLIYQLGQDPYKQNWGLMPRYYVTIEGKKYAVHWDHAEKFKEIKVGDKLNLHPSEYVSCIGESDMKPSCERLMKIYKTERRVNPLQTK
jgi:hypothetical protein